MPELGSALLARLGLQAADAGVLLGAFLASEGADGRGAEALERLEAPWSERCREAVTRIRALDAPQREAVLRALSQALLAPAEARPERERLADRLREVHPQVAAAVLTMVPPAVARQVAPPDAETCRLPAALRAQIARAELRALTREERSR